MTDVHPEPDIAKRLGAARFGGWRRGLRRLLLLVLVAAVAGAAVEVWRATRPTPAPRYQTQEARRGALTVTVTATGTLQPTKSVDVSSELSGIVRSVEVTYNDAVKVGQVLARLDTAKLEAQALQYKAALDSARAKLLQCQATVTEALASLTRLRRARELSGGKLPSQADLEAAVATLARAEADEASAQAATAQAQATLEATETDLQKSVIRSPINGVVLTRGVEPGQTVAATLSAPTLFTLAENLAQMELLVYVDEADVSRVKDGQGATFKVDAYPDRVFHARIKQVRYGSTTTNSVVTYGTVLSLDNADLSLRPGMTATALIVVQRVEGRVLVPNAALRFAPAGEKESAGTTRRGLLGRILPGPPPTPAKTSGNGDPQQPRVYTLRDGQPVAIPVATGATDGNLTEIVQGAVEPGMALVVDAAGTGS